MASRLDPTHPIRKRIVVALRRGDWQFNRRTDEWVRTKLEQAVYTKSEVVRRVVAFLDAGGALKQKENDQEGHEERYWYSVEVELDGTVRFLKFVLRPEEDEENPTVVFVSAHPPH